MNIFFALDESRGFGRHISLQPITMQYEVNSLNIRTTSMRLILSSQRGHASR
jgi:hypothetical protein